MIDSRIDGFDRGALGAVAHPRPGSSNEYGVAAALFGFAGASVRTVERMSPARIIAEAGAAAPLPEPPCRGASPS